MVYAIMGVLSLVALAVIFGFGKGSLDDPTRLSDAMLERVIRLNKRIMDNSRIGSPE